MFQEEEQLLHYSEKRNDFENGKYVVEKKNKNVHGSVVKAAMRRFLVLRE